MNIRQFFTVPRHATGADITLLILRLVGGIAFMLHGWPKIQAPFSWLGPDAFAPGIFQALAAFSEFAGGLAWILGLLMPLASLGILCTMTGAVYFHLIIQGDPFVGQNGSYELALVYFSVALLFIAMGPGRFSLDKAFFGNR